MNRRTFISRSALAIGFAAIVPRWLQKLVAQKEVVAPIVNTITLPHTGMFCIGDIIYIDDQRGHQTYGYVTEIQHSYMQVTRVNPSEAMPKRVPSMTVSRIASAYVEGRA